MDNISVSNNGCYHFNKLNNNNMNLTEIYRELQQIDEFHANFNPSDKSRARVIELTSLLQSITD